MTIRRMLPFILINILVSAAVVLGILYWWDGRQSVDTTPTPDTAVTGLIPTTAFAPPANPADTTLIATETAVPSDQPTIHTVQAGDTLGRIAEFYNIPLPDIMTVNNITDPNIISIGQQIIIPIGGIPTPIPDPTATPETAVLPSPNPTQPPTLGQVQLEIASLLGAGTLTDEAVQIVNTGSSQVGLLNWQLTDEDGYQYTFNLFTLFGDGSGVLVHTEAGQNSATDLFWGLEQPIWRTGERITLLDPDGNVRATYVVP